MKHKHLIGMAAISIILVAPIRAAYADTAPPHAPAGGLLNTLEPSTRVQMMSEDVLMVIGDDRADISATFTMLNQGPKEETLDVRFPVGRYWTREDGTESKVWGLDPGSFTATLAGDRGSLDTAESSDNGTLWLAWQATFPPGKTVTIEVSYQTLPSTYSYPIYDYILETGAGWYGAIGEGGVTFRLPYTLNNETLMTGFAPAPDYYTVAGTDILWQFTDLEPTPADDIHAGVMSPRLWREWQAAEKGAAENPDWVSAHLRLARSLRAISYDPYVGGCINGNCALYDRAREEYGLWLNIIPDQVVTNVIPNIVDYHLDYLELLADPMNKDWGPICPEVLRVANLAPTNKDVLNVKAFYSWCIDATLYPTPTLYAPPGCDPQAGRCPPPTATPTVTSVTLNPTSTPRPTQTPTIPPTLTATPTPNPQPPTPSLTLATLVGIAAVIIAGAGVGLWAARRKAGPAGD